MKTFFEHAAKQLLVLLVSASLAFAQTPPAPRKAAATQQELDQMLAPIALYPDSLLSQILMASTYPLEVVEAESRADGTAGGRSRRAEGLGCERQVARRVPAGACDDGPAARVDRAAR